jgi:hypothetical protein
VELHPKVDVSSDAKLLCNFDVSTHITDAWLFIISDLQALVEEKVTENGRQETKYCPS